MKSELLKILVVLTFSFSFLSCAQSTKQNNETETMEAVQKRVVSLISPEELNKITDEIQLIDVRTPKEFAEGHLSNAVNINFYDSNFMEEMSKLDKNKDLYIYCRSGGRSGKAAKKLKSQGFLKVYDLEGGILNWNQNKMKVVK